jgi:hypothetical protein
MRGPPLARDWTRLKLHAALRAIPVSQFGLEFNPHWSFVRFQDAQSDGGVQCKQHRKRCVYPANSSPQNTKYNALLPGPFLYLAANLITQRTAYYPKGSH